MTYRSIWVCISVADSRLTRSYLHPLTQLHFLLELPRPRRLLETAPQLSTRPMAQPTPDPSCEASVECTQQASAADSTHDPLDIRVSQLSRDRLSWMPFGRAHECSIDLSE